MEGDDAEADPDSEDIERAGEGVVAFARLEAGLVEIDHDGQAGKEEEQGCHEQVAAAAAVLDEGAEKAEEEGQHEEPVIGFIVLVDAVREFVLVAVEGVVDEGDAADPVAVAGVTEALEVVLFTREVPHKIAQVHPAGLVAGESI